MASTSPTSLSERAEAITQRNNGADPLPPPPVAAQSPFHEVMMGEITASLPGALKARMEAAPSVGDVCDWIAAGAVYRWIQGDPSLSRIFLHEVSTDPQRAGLALAKALAARLEPPPRDAQWHRYDYIGLALQLAVVGILLVCRSLLFSLLSPYGTASPPEFGLAALLRGVLGLDLLSGGLPGGLRPAAILGCAALWLGFEAIAAPRVMEHIRQLPARLKQLPPPLAWRADAFHVFWLVQATILLVCVCVRGGAHLAHIALSDAAPGGQRAIAGALGVLLIASVGLVVAVARSTVKLGTNTGRLF